MDASDQADQEGVMIMHVGNVHMNPNSVQMTLKRDDAGIVEDGSR